MRYIYHYSLLVRTSTSPTRRSTGVQKSKAIFLLARYGDPQIFVVLQKLQHHRANCTVYQEQKTLPEFAEVHMKQ